MQVETVQGDRRPKALDQALGVDGKPIFQEVQDVKVSDALDPLAAMEKQPPRIGVGSPQYRWHLAFAASRCPSCNGRLTPAGHSFTARCYESCGLDWFAQHSERDGSAKPGSMIACFRVV